MSDIWQYIEILESETVAPIGSADNPIIVDDSDDETMEDETCVICMDTVNRPKRLPCGHVYCYTCIGEYLKHVINVGYTLPWSRMKCPICRRYIPRHVSESIVSA
jgi:Zinc finger, C3HC4 type (RING finger)